MKIHAGKRKLLLETPWGDYFDVKPSWIPKEIEVSVGRGEMVVRRVVMERGAWIRVRPVPRSTLLHDDRLRLFHNGRAVEALFFEDKRLWFCLVPGGSYVVKGTARARGKAKEQTAQATVTARAGAITDVELKFGPKKRRRWRRR